MAKATVEDLAALLEQVQAQLAAANERLARLESGSGPAPAAASAAPAAAATPAAEPEPLGPTEEELLAISAALGAYLGVRVHIRQIRLVSSRAWAQEGRVSIQASHRLHS